MTLCTSGSMNELSNTEKSSGLVLNKTVCMTLCTSGNMNELSNTEKSSGLVLNRASSIVPISGRP